MNKEEVTKALAIMKAAYPNFYKTTEDIKGAIALWSMMFEEDDNKLVLMAVKMHISTNKFPPTIADIRGQMVSATTEEMGSETAWGKVQQAIRRFGYANKEKAIEYLGDELGTFTNHFGWRDLCMSENQMADRAHFIKMWDARGRQAKNNAMLPNGISNQINLMNNKSIALKGMGE